MNLIVFILISSVIFVSMLSLTPRRYGDGNEYFLMLESLGNHLSPDLRQEDIDGFYHGELNAFNEKIKHRAGYLKNANDSWYSIHFWAYSLFSLPVKLVLGLFNADARKVFQVTNALLFILALCAVNFVSKFSEGQKTLFMVLLSFSPALLFIHWTHPEIFIFSLITISLVMFGLERFGLAIIFAAIASFQNQALVVFVLFLLVKAILARFDLKSSVKYCALSSLVFLPNLFYLFTFGRFSLLSGSVFVDNITVLRIFEMFFDLNIGLFPYIPVSLMFFFGIVAFNAYKRRWFETQIFLLLIAMMLICAMTDNWNSDTSGPMRYVVWMMPFIFFVLTENIPLIFSGRLKYVFVVGMIIQLIIVIMIGPFISRLNYLDHTPPAKFVLNNFPALYSPSKEIFCERISHIELKCNNDPTIYKEGDECRKAILTCDGLKKLRANCPTTDISCEGNGTWFYVDY